MNHLDRLEEEAPSILVVRSYPSALTPIIDALRLDGLNVTVADGGHQALERTHFIAASLILLEVAAPPADGLEACRRLKAQPASSDIPVVVVSQLAEPGLVTAAFAAGAVDYIDTQVKIEELLAHIRRHVESRASQQPLVSRDAPLQSEIGCQQQSGIELAGSELRYRRLFETARDGVLLFALETGRIVDANPALLEMLQVSRASMCAHALWEVESFRELPALREIVEFLRTEGEVRHPCVRLPVKGAAAVTCEVIASAFTLAGEPLAQCNFRNISGRLKAEAQIRHMATHDAVTGLVNRIELENRLLESVLRARGRGTQVAVLMLDLDHFKNVNETLGHHAGDRLLKAVAQRLLGVLREGDLAARLGGDEFAIIVTDLADAREAATVAERVLRVLAEPFAIDGLRLRSGGSIGVSLYPVDADSADALLRTADTALFEAKRARRGTYRFFSPALQEAAKHRLRLSSDIQEAWAQGAFTLHYQPQVVLPGSSVVGVEALLRWLHPERGYVSPAHFIPLLDELGMLGEVGRWVLTTACRQARAWQEEGLGPVRVAVNLSAPEFYDADIVQSVQHALRESGLAPEWLEVEISESLPLGDAENAIRLIQALKQLGISLSLDDFGTGWSSLSHLRRFPLDKIKIDQSFVREVSHPQTLAVIQSILGLAANLGFSCVAEGVETLEQRDCLQVLGCVEMQGFLFSKPLPAEETEKLLRIGHCAPEQTLKVKAS